MRRSRRTLRRQKPQPPEALVVDDTSITRSHAIMLAEERRTLREGAAFLDEKCLLLAAEMLRQLHAWRSARAALRRAQVQARQALDAALIQHGLTGLHLLPAPRAHLSVDLAPRSLLGVTVQEAGSANWHDAPPAFSSPVDSAEARACAAAYRALHAPLMTLAVHATNLARLHVEYRRTVRRVRALQDVLLPDVEHTLAAVESGLDALEQEEAALLRRVAVAR
jgi:V/A-type H+-transporting ATPase subunit D